MRHAIGLGLALMACGPAVDEPPVGDHGNQGTASDSGGLDHGGSTAADSGADEVSTTAASSSGGDTIGAGELLPAESALTTVECNDDDTLRILVEAFLETEIQDCAFPPDDDGEDYLLISIPAWDGLPGVLEVGPDAPAQVGLADELMTGTVTVEIWAPTHPSALLLDLTGEGGTVLQGSIDLELCTTYVDVCPPGG